jgi:hypothetical protein
MKSKKWENIFEASSLVTYLELIKTKIHQHESQYW